MLLEALKLAIEQVASQLRHKKLNLELDLPDQLPPVGAASDSLRQISVILIENAIATSPAGSTLVVSVGSSDPEWVTLQVSDAGAGVSAEELGRAFQPELPAEGELALVRQLSEAAGGRVWIESELGKGSTITVQFPTLEGPSGTGS